MPRAALLALAHRRIDGPEATAYPLGGATSLALITIGVLLRLGLVRHPAFR